MNSRPVSCFPFQDSGISNRRIDAVIHEPRKHTNEVAYRDARAQTSKAVTSEKKLDLFNVVLLQVFADFQHIGSEGDGHNGSATTTS